MPTPISHAAVGLAVAVWTQRDVPGRRACIVAAACAALPDIDVIGWPLHVSSGSLVAHRALTHSLTFALVVALVATSALFRGDQWVGHRARIALSLSLALLSHGCLDGLTTYSLGVEFLAPFSQQRFRFLWTPLGDPSGGLAGQLVQESVVVLLPALLVASLDLMVRRRATPRHPA